MTAKHVAASETAVDNLSRDWAGNPIRFAAHQVGLPAFPDQTARPGPDEAHITGVTVHCWLAGLPLRVWGPSWLTGGTMTMRFRRHLVVGDPIQCTTAMVGSTLHFALESDGVGTVADGSAQPAGPTDHPDPRLFPVDAALPATPLHPRPEELVGQVLGSVQLRFDMSQDGPDRGALESDDPWRSLPFAHPAWLSTAVNALIRDSIAVPDRRWVHAGTSVRSIAPIAAGAAITVTARVDRLFDSSRHRFADIAAVVRSNGQPALTAMLTIVYGSVLGANGAEQPAGTEPGSR